VPTICIHYTFENLKSFSFSLVFFLVLFTRENKKKDKEEANGREYIRIIDNRERKREREREKEIRYF